MLLEVYQYHNDQFAELVNAEECALGTLKKFKSDYISLASFIKWKYGSEDYSIAELAHLRLMATDTRSAGLCFQQAGNS